MKKIFIFLLFIASLVSCTQSIDYFYDQTNTENDSSSSEENLSSMLDDQTFNFVSSEIGYQLTLPRIFAEHGSDGRVAASGSRTHHSFWNGFFEEREQIDIDIYHSSPSCSPSSLP